MKSKRKFKIQIAIVVIILLITASLAGGYFFTASERREAMNLPIGSIDFSQLKDGTFVGDYEGGMYKWRANKVQVTIASGKVVNIKLLEQTEKRPTEFTEELFGRVIQTQSLQVDAISGATLTSKAYLKGLENALNKAQINK